MCCISTLLHNWLPMVNNQSHNHMRDSARGSHNHNTVTVALFIIITIFLASFLRTLESPSLPSHAIPSTCAKPVIPRPPQKSPRHADASKARDRHLVLIPERTLSTRLQQGSQSINHDHHQDRSKNQPRQCPGDEEFPEKHEPTGLQVQQCHSAQKISKCIQL